MTKSSVIVMVDVVMVVQCVAVLAEIIVRIGITVEI